MGSSSIISERNAFRCDPGRIVQVKITGFCSASDRLGFVRSRNRSKWWTDYIRLKTSVKLQIDQMMRTRNFRVRSEVVERGAVTKSQKKGRKPTLKGKWESALSGKQMDNVRKEIHVVSVTNSGRKERTSSPAPKAKALTDRKIPSKSSSSRGGSPSWTKGRITRKDSLGGKYTNPSCNLLAPSRVSSGFTYGDKCRVRHVEVDVQPWEESKKSDGKGSVAL